MAASDPGAAEADDQRSANPFPGFDQLGDFIRAQRELMELSQRQLAKMARLSNPYLSQIERGLRNPSSFVLKALADGLEISAETLYTQAGILDPSGGAATDAASIAAPPMACTVRNRTPSSAARAVAPATVFGMSWSLRSRNTFLPRSRSDATTAGPAAV